MLGTAEQNLREDGFTLIEAMVVIAIVGILMAVAFPSYQLWIENTKTRNEAESIQSGLQLARAEATRRNANVEFVLTNNATVATTAGVGAAGSTTGVNWLVRVNTGAGFTAGDYIQGRVGTDGSRNVTINAAGVANAAGNAGVMTFTGLGRVNAAADQVINITNNFGDRPLRVTVTTAGLVRMCDPSPQLKPTDPKHC